MRDIMPVTMATLRRDKGSGEAALGAGDAEGAGPIRRR